MVIIGVFFYVGGKKNSLKKEELIFESVHLDIDMWVRA